MKPSSSSQRLLLITDFTPQTETLRQASRSKNKPPSTCKNTSRKFSDVHIDIPQTCKNSAKMIASSDHNQNTYIKKINKSRSNSNLSCQANSEVLNNQIRRQQVGNLYFQRIGNTLKKLLIEEKCKWDIDHLNYHQLLKILYWLKYIQYPNESEYMSGGDQEQLKKVYCLWLSISVKRVFSLQNLLQFIVVLQKVNLETEKIKNMAEQIKKQVSLQEDFDSWEQSSNSDPNFAFFMKKIQFQREEGSLQFGNQQKTLILQKFQSFKLNKLKDASITTCTKNTETEIDELPLVSKKSVELASAKRQKITAEIKTRHPQVQNIDLFDLLNYRERDFGHKGPRTPTQHNVSRFAKKKKNIKQMKKQINQLSKPKQNGQELTIDELQYERNKEDYTFTPKINFFRNSSQQKLKNIKNIQKTVLRMKEAREIKQHKENLISKGWTASQVSCKKKGKEKQKKKVLEVSNQNSSNTEQSVQKAGEQGEKPKKYEVSKDYLRIPILYIDVNIEEGRKQRIVIYDNDTAVGLANQFGNKHGKKYILTQDCPMKQSKDWNFFCSKQMDTVLARIDEETEDECSIIF